MEAIRNNCDVVADINPPDGFLIYLDNGGTANVGAGNQSRDGDETIIANVTVPNAMALQIDAAEFSGTTVCGFTSRGLPLLSRSGNVVIRTRGTRPDVWYRVVLSPSGQVNLQRSSDSTDGVDGQWVK